jgi:hypothetical protein
MWAGEDLTIRKLARNNSKDHKTIPESMWDATKPDGTQENNGCF